MGDSELLNDPRVHDALDVDDAWAAGSGSGGSREEVDEEDDAGDDAARRPRLRFLFGGGPGAQGLLCTGPWPRNVVPDFILTVVLK